MYLVPSSYTRGGGGAQGGGGRCTYPYIFSQDCKWDNLWHNPIEKSLLSIWSEHAAQLPYGDP